MEVARNLISARPELAALTGYTVGARGFLPVSFRSPEKWTVVNQTET